MECLKLAGRAAEASGLQVHDSGFGFFRNSAFPSFPFTETLILKALDYFFQISEFIIVFSFLNMRTHGDH